MRNHDCEKGKVILLYQFHSRRSLILSRTDQKKQTVSSKPRLLTHPCSKMAASRKLFNQPADGGAEESQGGKQKVKTMCVFSVILRGCLYSRERPSLPLSLIQLFRYRFLPYSSQTRPRPPVKRGWSRLPVQSEFDLSLPFTVWPFLLRH